MQKELSRVFPEPLQLLFNLSVVYIQFRLPTLLGNYPVLQAQPPEQGLHPDILRGGVVQGKPQQVLEILLKDHRENGTMIGVRQHIGGIPEQRHKLPGANSLVDDILAAQMLPAAGNQPDLQAQLLRQGLCPVKIPGFALKEVA